MYALAREAVESRAFLPHIDNIEPKLMCPNSPNIAVLFLVWPHLPKEHSQQEVATCMPFEKVAEMFAM